MKRDLLWTSLFVILISSLLSAEVVQKANFGDYIAFWNAPKIWVAAALALIGTALLMLKKLNARLRLAMMVVAFFAFGVVGVLPLGDFAAGMGLHPSPMCVIEKPFLFVKAGRAIPVVCVSIFVFIARLTLLSNKSFCGWTCPIGAVQEIVYKIPVPKKLRKTLPFKVSNIVRLLAFLLFVVLTFAAGISLYQYINAFHILHWQLSATLIAPIIVAIIGALFVYRPFCYLFCPIGLFTWLLEQASIARIKLDKEACTMCNICVKKSPCPTVPSILEMKRFRPDCHDCGVCIEACPEDALKFRV